MIEVENIKPYGFETAIRGLRNPMNSWDKSDSYYLPAIVCNSEYIVGQNDLDLMKRLYKAGVEHRTFARMIQVSMDITAPLYWWKEMDRYTVGKTQISTSTMHKIHEREFTVDDFSCEHLDNFGGYENKAMFYEWFVDTLSKLNIARQLYISTGDKQYWWQIIQILPSSYNQKRTVLMSYEVVFKIIKERTRHKLDEWNEFCDVLRDLPYVEEIMNGSDDS